MSDTLAILEEKVAFLEEALQQLSDEHFAQQKDLLELREQLRRITNRINNQSLDDDSSSDMNDKPPHY